MRRWCVFVGVCLSASGVARADEPAGQPSSLTNAAKDAAFAALVEKADRARLAGRLDDAAAAYAAALEVQRHPVISGRLGVILVKLGQADRAAEELQEAIERGHGVPPWERRDFLTAFDKAHARTTRVNVNISQVGTKVTYDGAPRNREGFSAFWMRAMPGEHTLRAALEGYEDAVATFIAKPGEEIEIDLKLVPLSVPNLPELPAPSTAPPAETRNFPPWLPASNIATDPSYSPKEDPFYEEPKPAKPPEKRGPRFSVSGGVVTVFGVASWNPAVGGVVGVGLRPHENFSLGLEGRAAWLTTGVADLPISAMTAGGILTACGHLRWFFGCGLGYVGTINVEFSDLVYTGKSASFVQPGFGGRVGFQTRLGSAFLVHATGDVLGMFRGIELRVGDRVVATQAPVMVGVQIGGGWEF